MLPRGGELRKKQRREKETMFGKLDDAGLAILIHSNYPQAPLMEHALIGRVEAKHTVVLLSNFRFEGLQVAIDAPLGASVTLLSNFSEEMDACALSILPSFEHIWGKHIKGTLPLASSFGFGKGSSRKPSLHCTVTEAKLASNFLGLHASFAQLHHLLIARVASSSSSQPRLLDMSGLWRTPFFDGDDWFTLLILMRFFGFQ